ncbi:MAG: hypothetical protein E7058_07870 [Lentisphaerae bacterium]|nr:hypothetical protein [Lentisphaerota bacterium]
MICHRISAPVRHHECDAAGELKLHCLLDRMQDAAAEHASALNVGMEELAEMQLIWVLSRLKIHLDKPLPLGGELEIVTYPSGVQRIFAHRCYDIKLNSARAGYAGSFWLPVNAAVNRPVNARKVLPPEIMDLPEVEKFFPDMDKLPEVAAEICASRQVGAGDIDLNRHLNNAVYARWISDILGEKLHHKAVRVSEIQLNYLAAGQFGDEIFMRADVRDNGGFAVSGEKSDGTIIFQSSGIAEI